MKMKRIFFVAALLFCIAFSNLSFAVTKWACVGDSITAGWKLKVADYYSTKLSILLGSEYDVQNFGHTPLCHLLFVAIGFIGWRKLYPSDRAFTVVLLQTGIKTRSGQPGYPACILYITASMVHEGFKVVPFTIFNGCL